MPRIKLMPAARYNFSRDIDVRISDINFAGHVAGTAIVSIIHDARISMLKEMGFSEADLGEPGVGIIIGDLALNYMAEAFLSEVITIESAIAEPGDKGFRIQHRLSVGSRIIALAETGAVAFDYSRRIPVSLPRKFRDAVERFEF